MQTLTVMSTVWAVSVAAFVVLMVYRARLTNHETDELFLSAGDDDSNRKHEHDDILRKVNRIRPYCQGAGGIAALTTVAVVGLEVARIAAMMN